MRPSTASSSPASSCLSDSDINANPSSSSILSEMCRSELGLSEEEVARSPLDLAAALHQFDREVKERIPAAATDKEKKVRGF